MAGEWKEVPRNIDLDPIGPTSPLTLGLLENFGCFGPFPCLNPNMDGPSAIKRKRTDVDALDFTFSSPSKQFDALHQTENNIVGDPMMHTTNHRDQYSKSINDIPSVLTNDRSGHVNCSKPNENAHIAEIGALVGFQTEADNHILASLLVK